MERKPTDRVQIGLRLPDDLRAELKRLMAKSGRSLNGEIVHHLWGAVLAERAGFGGAEGVIKALQKTMKESPMSKDPDVPEGYAQEAIDAEAEYQKLATMTPGQIRYYQMRLAINDIELALNELDVVDIVRNFEGAGDGVMVHIPLKALRAVGRCFDELNRIANDPEFADGL